MVGKAGVIIIVFFIIAAIVGITLAVVFLTKKEKESGGEIGDQTDDKGCVKVGIQMGNDYNDFDLDDTNNIPTSPNVEGCLLACNLNPACHFAVYKDTTNECFRKTLDQADNKTVGLKIENQSKKVSCPRYKTFSNTLMKGFDLKKIDDIETESSCQQECDNNSSCDVYEYDSKNNVCRLKQSRKADSHTVVFDL